MHIDPQGFGESLCSGMFMICECTNVYHGEGTLLSNEDARATFEGSFELVESDCTEVSMLKDLIWLPAEGQKGHQTIRFIDDASTVQTWILHRDADDVTPFESDQKAQGQFWIGDMMTAVAEDRATYHHVEVGMADVVTFQLTHDLDIRFNVD